MTPIFQQIAGDEGDCLRACIASILDLPADVVPVFEGSNAYLQNIAVRSFLRGFGYTYTCVVYRALDDDPGPGPVLRAFGVENDDLYYILTGLTERGVGHAVVCYGNEIVHDPSGHPDTIVAPDDKHYTVGIIAYKGGHAPVSKRSRVRRLSKREA